MDHLLAILFFWPLAGALAAALMPRARGREAKALALGFLAVEFLLSVQLCGRFDRRAAGMQCVERYEWIPSLGIHFHLGIDGLSLALIGLTVLLMPVALGASWSQVRESAREFAVLLLLLTALLVGAFAAQDLFLFFVCAESALLPLALLVGLGGGEDRRAAAARFAFYHLGGSLVLLAGIVALAAARQHFGGSMSLEDLYQLELDPGVQRWLLGAFLLGLAVKMPLFPLHGWWSGTAAASSAAGVVVLAGIWSQMGLYGLVRLCIPLFPEAFAEFSPHLALLATVGALYSALLALAQTEVRRRLAHASVHWASVALLGLCSLNAQGLTGGTAHAVNRGLSAGIALLLAALFAGRRLSPPAAACWLLALLSLAGAPGLNGFASLLLVCSGAFAAFPLYAGLALLGSTVVAVALLRAVRLSRDEAQSAGGREVAAVAPALLVALWIGLQPRPLLQAVEQAGEILRERLHLVEEVQGEAQKNTGMEEP